MTELDRTREDARRVLRARRTRAIITETPAPDAQKGPRGRAFMAIVAVVAIGLAFTLWRANQQNLPNLEQASLTLPQNSQLAAGSPQPVLAHPATNLSATAASVSSPPLPASAPLEAQSAPAEAISAAAAAHSTNAASAAAITFEHYGFRARRLADEERAPFRARGFASDSLIITNIAGSSETALQSGDILLSGCEDDAALPLLAGLRSGRMRCVLVSRRNAFAVVQITPIGNDTGAGAHHPREERSATTTSSEDGLSPGMGTTTTSSSE